MQKTFILFFLILFHFFDCFAQIKIEPMTSKKAKSTYTMFLKLDDDRFYGAELDFSNNKQSNLPSPTLMITIYENADESMKPIWLQYYMFIDDGAKLRYDEDGYIEIHCIHGRYRQGTHKYDIPHLSFYKNIHTGYEFDISLKGYDFEGNLYLKITELSFIKPWNKYVEREQKKMPELMRTFMINNWKRMHK